MEKCYLVESSSGQYEDFRTKIEGIFLDVFDANKLKDKIEKEADIARNIENPFEGKNIDTLTDSQFDIYIKWSDAYYCANEFNSVYVNEYPIGVHLNN